VPSVLSFRVERNGASVIVPLYGSLTRDDTYPLISECMALIRRGERRLILDFENVKFIDSAGIGMLLMLSAECQQAGGRMGLSGSSSAVAEILNNVTRNLIFKLYQNAAAACEAMEALTPPPPDCRPQG
jgi:anti-sigma B factor antagonist